MDEKMSKLRRIETGHILKMLTIALIPLAIVWSVVYPFARFRLPIGWDTPAYLGYATSIFRYGWGYVMNPTFIEWKGLRVVPTIPLWLFLIITKDINISYVIWVSTLSISYLASVYYVSREVLRKPQMVFYSLLFASISYNYLRMTRYMFDPILGLTLMNVAIGCLVAFIRKGTFTKWNYFLFFFSQLMMWFTHLEIAAISSFVLIAISSYAYISSPRHRSQIPKAVFSTILVSVIAAAFWTPMLPPYFKTLDFYLGGWRDLPGPLWRVMWRQIQKALVILEFMSIAQILLLIRRGRADAGRQAVFIWTLTILPFILIAYVLTPMFMFRIVFLLPISLLLSYGSDLVIEMLLHKKKVDLRWVSMHVSTRVSKSLAGVFLAAIVVTTAIDASQQVVWARPYISSQEVTALESLANYIDSQNIENNDLILALYPPQRTNPEDIRAWILLYDNWIQTYVGNHLTYYGPVENLLTGVPLNTTSYEEEFVFQYYWIKLVDSQENSNFTEYFVAFLPYWYCPITSYEMNISKKVDNHFYIVKPANISNPP